MSLLLIAPDEITSGIAARARARRLALNLTQEGLARRSGVSLPSLKRFERTGQISLESLLKLALVLDCLSEFETLFSPKSSHPASLDALLAAPPARKKGRLK